MHTWYHTILRMHDIVMYTYRHTRDMPESHELRAVAVGPRTLTQRHTGAPVYTTWYQVHGVVSNNIQQYLHISIQSSMRRGQNNGPCRVHTIIQWPNSRECAIHAQYICTWYISKYHETLQHQWVRFQDGGVQKCKIEGPYPPRNSKLKVPTSETLNSSSERYHGQAMDHELPPTKKTLIRQPPPLCPPHLLVSQDHDERCRAVAV